MTLRTITNHQNDFTVWDLDPSRARGPFVIVQEGCAPRDETAKVRLFVMRRDGVWVDVAYYLAGEGQKKLDQILFLTTADVMSLLQGIGSKPKVADLSASQEQIHAWHLAHPQFQPGLAGLRQWATDFRQRKMAQP